MPEGKRLLPEHKRAVQWLRLENPEASVNRIHDLLKEDLRFRKLPGISNRSVRNIFDAMKKLVTEAELLRRAKASGLTAKNIELPPPLRVKQKYSPFPSDRVAMHKPMWDEKIDGKPLIAVEKVFLLKLDEVTKSVEGYRLFIHERKWACRIRTALFGLTWLEVYRFVKLYGMRETIAHWDYEPKYNVQGVLISSPEIYTADLDGILAYSPWLSARTEKAYEFAVEEKIIPPYWTYYDDSSRVDKPSHWQIVQEALYAYVEQILFLHEEDNAGLDLLQKYWDGDPLEGET